MAYQAQFERLELKYGVDESTARAIADAVSPYCDADDYNPGRGKGYRVSSLYFDTPELIFFRSKSRSDHDRLKLRARTYDDKGPVSLEIKRKRGDVIWKRRAQVARENFEAALRGEADPLSKDAFQVRALSNFAHLYAQFDCAPKVAVHYEREAYISRVDAYARVTFDRRITAEAVSDLSLKSSPADCPPVASGITDSLGSSVILELKCEQFVPPWLVALVRDFDLTRVSYSKYNSAVIANLNAGLEPNTLFERSFDFERAFEDA